MLNKTWIYRDTMLLPNCFNASTRAERMEPSFSLSFCPCFCGFLFLPFPCSVAILSPVFFLFLGLFRLVCWCCFMSFHCCACFLISCYLILLVFPLSHLPFLPFLFCFSVFFHVYISTFFSYLLSFPSLYSWLSMVQWPWCKEGKPRGCCSQVLPRAGGCSCKPPGFVRLG